MNFIVHKFYPMKAVLKMKSRHSLSLKYGLLTSTQRAWICGKVGILKILFNLLIYFRAYSIVRILLGMPFSFLITTLEDRHYYLLFMTKTLKNLFSTTRPAQS